MKRVLLSAALFIGFSCLYGQIDNQNNQKPVSVETPAPQDNIKKVEYSLNTGTSFSMGNYKSSSYYIAPQLTYQFSPKFKLNTGFVFINSSSMVPSNAMLNFGQQNSGILQQKTNETIVFAKGEYQLNNKLTITGSAMKNFNSPMNAKMQENAWRNSFQMMSMGFRYKISNNMTLGAEVKMVETNNLFNPLYYNMYQFGSPNFGF